VTALDLDDARLADQATEGHFPTIKIKFAIVHPNVKETAKFKTVTLKSTLGVEGKFAFAVLFHC
jgi:hypothetical protein